MFGGRLPRLRVKAMPLAIAVAWVTARCTSAWAALMVSRVIFFRARGSAFWLLNWSKLYSPSTRVSASRRVLP
ncbi:hypothetical protein D3C85_1396780 [compost metagenome]